MAPAITPQPVDPPVVEPAPPQPTVSDLLAQSRRAHLLYHQESPRMAANGPSVQMQPGDPAAAREWLKQAAAARAQAEVIDPMHSDPSWADEANAFPHQELLVYYLQQLSK